MDKPEVQPMTSFNQSEILETKPQTEEVKTTGRKPQAESKSSMKKNKEHINLSTTDAKRKELSKETKDILIEKILKLEDEIKKLRNRKGHKFTKEEVEKIKNDNCSIRNKAVKYGCAKKTIEKIMNGTYFDKL